MDIEIKIKDALLRAYLEGLFDKDGEAYVASSKTLTGAIICSSAQVSEVPRRHPDHGRPDCVAFRLSRADYNSDLLNKHLYMTPTAEARVNTVLRREFDVNFIKYCVDHKTMGLTLKETIDRFMTENNMVEFFLGDIEMLKKRFYRYEISTLKEAREELRQRSYNQRNRKYVR